MKRGILTLAVVWVVLAGVEAVDAARGSGSSRREGAARAVGKSSRPSSTRTRRRGWRVSRRPVRIRPSGATLPQVRAELSRLETGLGARLQRIEKAAARPPRPTVVVAPPPPPAPAPEFPLVPAVVGALAVSTGTGVLGFALGQAWARRRSPGRGEATLQGEPGPGRHERGAARPFHWSQIHERLDLAERRLSAARARIRRLDRMS